LKISSTFRSLDTPVVYTFELVGWTIRVDLALRSKDTYPVISAYKIWRTVIIRSALIALFTDIIDTLKPERTILVSTTACINTLPVYARLSRETIACIPTHAFHDTAPIRTHLTISTPCIVDALTDRDTRLPDALEAHHAVVGAHALNTQAIRGTDLGSFTGIHRSTERRDARLSSYITAQTIGTVRVGTAPGAAETICAILSGRTHARVRTEAT
jgi:hypothetical protein